MRPAIRLSLIALLLGAPMGVPLAWSLLAPGPATAQLALGRDGMLVHGVSANPRALPAGATMLIDGVPANPGALTIR